MKKSIESTVLPFDLVSPIKYDLPSHVALNAALSDPDISNGAWEFLYERYTYIHCMKSKRLFGKSDLKYDEVHISYPRNPFIKHMMKPLFNTDPKVVLNRIFKYINRRMCVRIKLDTYYLPGYKFYQKKHFLHSEVIYGVDLENEKLYLCGHAHLFEHGLEKNIISFKEFIDAFDNAVKDKPATFMICDKICKNNKYKFNLKKMYRGLCDYYTANSSLLMWLKTQIGKNPFVCWEAYIGHVFGIDVPKNLRALVDSNRAESTPRNCVAFFKIFVAILDFSNIMKLRVDFLNKTVFAKNKSVLEYDADELTEKFDAISNNYLILRNYLFRMVIVSDEEKCKRNVEKMISLMDRTYQMEVEAGEELLADLKAVLDQ